MKKSENFSRHTVSRRMGSRTVILDVWKNKYYLLGNDAPRTNETYEKIEEDSIVTRDTIGLNKESEKYKLHRIYFNVTIAATIIIATSILSKVSFFLLVKTMTTISKKENKYEGNKNILEKLHAFRIAKAILPFRTDCLVTSASFYHLGRLLGFPVIFTIGISLDPFKAHAWARIGDTVLTDNAGSVRSYYSILSIGK